MPVRAGARWTETQLLAALLLPSANNIAIVLARKVSGTVARFVRWMNSTARRLGMTHTRYTDPSGFDPATVSTASDLTRLATRALRSPMLRKLVRTKSYRIPVSGVVHNTNRLIGVAGFAGIKTGSMSQSGGCLMFVSHRVLDGRRVAVVGVVLGQYGKDGYGATAARVARRLVRQVAPAVAPQ